MIDNIFYVYQLRVSDEDLPFYVGKGFENRCYHHFWPYNLIDGSHKSNVINKRKADGKIILVEFIEIDLLEKDAFTLEKYYISAYGRYDKSLGILTNKTDGGEGNTGARASYITTEKFIKKAQIKHGTSKFDYSEVKYISQHEPVLISCMDHGSFWMAPSMHLRGVTGCKRCGEVKRNEDKIIARRHEIKELIINNFGDKFDLSKINYVNSYTDIELICPIHGSFFTNPGNLLNQSICGCRKCGNDSQREKLKAK